MEIRTVITDNGKEIYGGVIGCVLSENLQKENSNEEQ